MKIMGFGAHPGDMFLAAAGTLAKHSRRGDEVFVVSLSYGERSHAFTIWEKKRKGEKIPPLEEIKEMKKEEFERAADIIGAEARILGFDECPLKVDESELLTLVETIREIRPDVVLSNWIRDWLNHDHEVAGECVMQACTYAGCQGLETRKPPYDISNIYYYVVNPICFAPEIGFIPDFYIDIDGTIDLKIKALCEFKTQRFTESYMNEFFRSIHYFLGYRSNIKYAEAFKRVWSPPKPYEYLR